MPTGVYKRKPFSKEHRENIGKFWIGKKRSDAIRKKISIGNMGKKLSDNTKKKMSLSHLGLLANDKNGMWKGSKVGYHALHTWIQRKFGKANKCEKCKTIKAKRYEWANVTGVYNRDRKNWMRLCSKCHHKKDDNTNKGWETRKKLK